MMALKPVKQEKIWCFSVCDPQLHPKGFTIYKVTCKFFPINRPESLTEIICWKRYNDFKELFKVMLNLHKALHRRDEFPPFAKPKLFGRFDEAVIEERRQSALSLLNFIGHQPHLYNSKHFQTFWVGGKVSQSGFHAGPVLRPSKLDILSDHDTSNVPPDVVPILESQPAESAKSGVQPNLSNVTSPVSEVSEISQLSVLADKEVKLLEGTWNFPQVPDTISLGSSVDVDEFGDTDADSPLGSSLPDTDLSFFDPIKSDPGGHSEQEHDLTQSVSWLIRAKTTCANMDDIDGEMPLGAEAVNEETGIPEDLNHSSCSDSKLKQVPDTVLLDHSGSVRGSRDDLTGSCQSGHSDRTFDISEFDPLRTRSLSKVECGKGDIDLSRPSSISQGSINSVSSVSSTTRSSRPVSRGCSMTPSPRKQRTGTQSSVSTMDLGGKDDYIYLAANQICLAQECEANGSYETAFTCYKTGVGILLQGVQADNNKARRDAVRRKTAQYLIKAEDLYNLHLAKDSSDEWRWSGIDTVLSPAMEIDPALAFVRGSISELRNFKVLGTVHKVILVMDKSSDETYCVRTIHKTSMLLEKKPTILPTSCPYMVSLYKFYETEDAIYLLLQYASGGKLWTYIGAYINSMFNAAGDEINLGIDLPDSKNIYSGQKTHTTDRGNIEQTCMNRSKDPTLVSGDEHKRLTIEPDTSDGLCIKFVNQVSPEEDVVQNDSLLDDSTLSSSGKKPDYNRLSSMSSDGFQVGDISNLSLNANCMDDLDQEEHFDDILQQTRPSLEKFSINSFDSDGFHRLDSVVSDHIESIPETNESPTGDHLDDISLQVKDDVFSNKEFVTNQNETVLSATDEQFTTGNINMDAEQIIHNSMELIKSVEQILSESAGMGQSPTTSAPGEAEMDNTREMLNSVEHRNFSPRSLSPGRITNTSRDSAEPSIYDIHRSPTDSDSEVDKPCENVCDTNGEDQSGVCDSSAPQSVDSVSHSDSDVKSAIVDKTTDTDSKAATLLTKLPGNTASVTRLTLSRMNSNDLMTRSASFECDMKSPTKNRARAMSSLFEQLDSVNPEQVKLPESCIRRWAAEIVCALSRLHDFGIICRDLKPDNILLGDRGHILLTYFCQFSQTDRIIDQRAVEQMYVAPEVDSISGYSEVCDWWSLGALLYELLVGKSLLHCHPGGINSHTQLHVPSHVSTEGQALLQELLHFNQHERLGSGIDGAEAIKAHPFFSDINWNSVENQ
ncbi:ribosomal protein S6 kinase delta-1-like [Gigantopelta aegis]|uniref:ribosomal protein S6 kinase delta-1-like n=1 Tax=Gigantopelta aegis TaxID=1735272 RepID=UPI001B888DC1|nr:ribosomal protein S6 kinase delta-1-like [Gigantopelta aegis]